jgi:hypothetical protein
MLAQLIAVSIRMDSGRGKGGRRLNRTMFHAICADRWPRELIFLSARAKIDRLAVLLL